MGVFSATDCVMRRLGVTCVRYEADGEVNGQNEPGGPVVRSKGGTLGGVQGEGALTQKRRERRPRRGPRRLKPRLWEGDFCASEKWFLSLWYETLFETLLRHEDQQGTQRLGLHLGS